MLPAKFGNLTTKSVHFLSLTAEVLRNHCFLLLCRNVEVCFVKVSSHIPPRVEVLEIIL